MDDLAQVERELLEQSARLNSLEEYLAWEEQWDECIKSLEEHSRGKRSKLSIGYRRSLIARIAYFESVKSSLHRRFVHAGAGHSVGLRWREIDSAFKSRILTGAVINSNYIEPRNFLEDARNMVIEHVRNTVERHNSVKVNTVFNGEFVAGDKRSNIGITTKNYELYRCSDLEKWYQSRIIEPILASLDEFEESDSGWTLSSISNLTVNVNKYNPMHAGCNIELPKEIIFKKAIINVKTEDNACFAWSVVAALYPAKKKL
jgi:hypothetical protein